MSSSHWRRSHLCGARWRFLPHGCLCSCTWEESKTRLLCSKGESDRGSHCNGISPLAYITGQTKIIFFCLYLTYYKSFPLTGLERSCTSGLSRTHRHGVSDMSFFVFLSLDWSVGCSKLHRWLRSHQGMPLHNYDMPPLWPEHNKQGSRECQSR